TPVLPRPRIATGRKRFVPVNAQWARQTGGAAAWLALPPDCPERPPIAVMPAVSVPRLQPGGERNQKNRSPVAQLVRPRAQPPGELARAARASMARTDRRELAADESFLARVAPKMTRP